MCVSFRAVCLDGGKLAHMESLCLSEGHCHYIPQEAAPLRQRECMWESEKGTQGAHLLFLYREKEGDSKKKKEWIKALFSPLIYVESGVGAWLSKINLIHLLSSMLHFFLPTIYCSSLLHAYWSIYVWHQSPGFCAQNPIPNVCKWNILQKEQNKNQK